MIDDAEASNSKAIPRIQRNACIKTDVGIPSDILIIVESLVLLRILDDEFGSLWFKNGVAAKRVLARGLSKLYSVARLDPLSLIVDQCNKGDRGAGDLSSHLGKTIQEGIVSAIENIIAEESSDAFLFPWVEGRRD